VTTSVLSSGNVPRQLERAGWKTGLYVRGELNEGPSIAIVGARAATTVAMERAHSIAKHLASGGARIISGGALGIDGAAHRGALAGGGRTTVVLGSGVDVLYPARHAPLFRNVLEHGGALVSMLPDGTEPRAHTFVMRNPLIAALADATIVIEADVYSGSLSTAAAANKLGRLVAAWPGSAGCDRLLGQGAAIVESIQDADLVVQGTPRMPTPIIDTDPDTASVRAAIAAGAVGVDAIVRHTGLTLRAVLRALHMLERYS